MSTRTCYLFKFELFTKTDLIIVCHMHRLSNVSEVNIQGAICYDKTQPYFWQASTPPMGNLHARYRKWRDSLRHHVDAR